MLGATDEKPAQKEELKGSLTRAVQCWGCGGKMVHRSHRRNRWEYLISIVGVYPFRCEDCYARFKVFSWRGKGRR
jgi:hypothetical protein